MDVCFKCGLKKRRLFDIVGEDGIISVCGDCSGNDEFPVIKKPLNSAFDNIDARKTIYERLSSLAGINPDEHRNFEKNAKERASQDAELREIINKNLQLDFAKNLEVNVDLVRNFHWIIMRARRLKKITLGELAKKIAEPEEVLKMIEKGVVLKENFELIRKLEIFLSIHILSSDARKKINSTPNKEIGFDPVTTRVLTIDDLREMKKKREEQIFK